MVMVLVNPPVTLNMVMGLVNPRVTLNMAMVLVHCGGGKGDDGRGGGKGDDGHGGGGGGGICDVCSELIAHVHWHPSLGPLHPQVTLDMVMGRVYHSLPVNLVMGLVHPHAHGGGDTCDDGHGGGGGNGDVCSESIALVHRHSSLGYHCHS
ncbi:hypothetical protein LIER_12372 [Lithospermum erythrorhizon]|uniref:Uncharacterized protein n=1 Tax=Lithospermum erythrorhizon TaxID=34254 RepID=A0AAV3PRM9_LITER